MPVHDEPTELEREIEHDAEVGLVPLHQVPTEPEIEREHALVEQVDLAEPALEPDVELVAPRDEEPTPATALCVAFASTRAAIASSSRRTGRFPTSGSASGSRTSASSSSSVAATRRCRPTSACASSSSRSFPSTG